MKRLSFGRGFVPRIGRDNHRALAPPGLFGDEPSEIPWIIVDGAWAKPDTPLLAHLHNLGVRVLVDSQPWRFADERTWEVAKYASLGHRPPAPLDLDDIDALAGFVEADLEWQLALGADALLLPGLMPEKDDDAGVRGLTLATEVAMTSNLTKGRPIVGFLGGHSRSIDLVNAVAEDSVIPLLSAVYIQISPVNPMNDPTSKLIDVSEAMVSSLQSNSHESLDEPGGVETRILVGHKRHQLIKREPSCRGDTAMERGGPAAGPSLRR